MKETVIKQWMIVDVYVGKKFEELFWPSFTELVKVVL